MAANLLLGYILLIVFVIALAVYDFCKKKQFLIKNVKNIPVVPYLPWIGSAHMIFKNIKAGFRVFEQGIRLTGSDHFICFHGPLPVYMTTNPDDLEIILPNVLDKGLPYEFINDHIIDRSLLTASVAAWKINRKIMNKCFKQQMLNKKIPSINEAMKKHLTVFSGVEQGKKISEMNGLFLMNMFIKHFIPFYYEEAKDNMTGLYEAMKLNLRNPFVRLYKPWLYPNIFYKLSEMKRKSNRLNNENDKMLNVAIDHVKDGLLREIINEDSDDLMTHLEKGGVDRDITVQECKLFTNAASDTTSLVFSMVLVAFGIYPEVQDKVLKEVLEVVGPTDPIEQYHLPDLKYTEMVVKETLRFFPSVPLIMRKTTAELKLAHGKILPKDMEIFVSLYNLHRNEKYWNNPLEFDPNRFLPEEVEKRHPFAYLPFSNGTRNCPGYKYAMIILVVGAAHFARKFKIECSSHKSIADVELRTHMTLDMADKNLKCTFTPR